MKGNSFRISFVWIMVAAMWFAACGSDKGTNSNAPKLELVQQEQVYNSNFQYDSLIFFQLFYEDADGDIGLGDGDTTGDFAFGAPYFYTFFCHVYTLKNDSWIEVPNPFDPTQNIQFHERFPDLTPTGSDKRLSGELELFIPARPNGLELDTVRFEMQLFDRALHKSNICYSKEFILKHP